MIRLVRSVINVTVIAVVIIFVIIDVAVIVFMGKVVLSYYSYYQENCRKLHQQLHINQTFRLEQLSL